jgi:hypothetical protein
MKARLIFVLVLVLVTALRMDISAQTEGWWTLSGLDLYPNSTSYNVGIGTTQPASKFHMMRSDNGAAPGQRFNDAAIFENNGNVFLQLHGSEGGEKSINFAKPSNGADGAIKYNYTNVPNGFGFWVDGNQFKVAIDQLGRIGVLDNTPNTEVDVFGDMHASDGLKLGTTLYPFPEALLAIDNRELAPWFDLIRAIDQYGQDVFILNDSGRTYRLDVAGAVHASSFPTSSDARLKSNISQLTEVLDKLEKIRGVSFDWNEEYAAMGRATGHREIGVIAQEVEGVFPELVTTWGTENYRAVDYGRLTAVLLEAIKELRAEKDAQIAALSSEIASLQERVAALEHQNALLAQQVAAFEAAEDATDQHLATIEVRLAALERKETESASACPQ